MIKQQELDLITDYLADKPVIKAYLFGSQVSGQTDNSSDIDLLVELDYSQTIGIKFITMRYELQKLLNSKIDLVSINALSKRLITQINREKKLIYAR